MNNNGYTRIPHELMRNPNLPPIAKVVWSLIAGMRPGFNATLSQYCKMVACHPNTWRSIIKMLELFGMISVEYRANGVTYTAITDTSKWSVEGNKICNPNKNCKGNKNCNGKGNKNCEARGNKICDPSEEQKNNNTTTPVRVCAREKLVAELLTDGRKELAMMKYHISVEQYRQLIEEIITDWEFRGLPDEDYNLNHFLVALRTVVAKQNRNNGQRTDDKNQRAINAGAAAIAALAAQSGKPVDAPF